MKKKITSSFILLFFISLFTAKAQMRIHLINIGQGSATLVEFPCAAVLIDLGGENNAQFNSTDSLKAYLRDFFDRRTDLHNTLQCVYITHPHADHANTHAAGYILDSFKIKNVVTDGLEQGSGRHGQIKLHRAVQASEEDDSADNDIGFEAVVTNEIGATGFTNAVIDAVDCPGTDPVITILWGTSATKPAGWTDDDFDNENFHSLVIKIEYGSSSFLITGDLEDKAQKNLVAKYNSNNMLDADIYLVGHHGSKNGSSQELLSKVTPKMALMGVGSADRQLSWTAWDYGHPNKTILERLQANLTESRSPITVQAGTKKQTFGSFIVSKAIYATGWDGNIILEADTNGNWQKASKLVPSLVNINTATLSELLTLPGIGETKGQAIIDYRSGHGNFTTIEELDNVPGIGPATINLLRPYVRL
ncbi:MAG: hypothetical protein HOP10_00765 [Chitinophagaceae bacterium]|nr:hypothetical protein [Chitinophagaceae bacterium]